MNEDSVAPVSLPLKGNWSRAEQAAKLAEREASQSQRQQARETGVARTTLQYWQQRQGNIEASAAVVTFFESPEGVEVLHQIVIAAQFVITLLGCGGVRLVCQFLELSGLSAFVASSYGAQQKLNVALEQAVVEHGRAEQARLGPLMESRSIVLCQDETFHPEICLVGIEPVSNFIVLERYAPNRTAACWTQALDQSLNGLPVEVIEVTSDAATGLCRHVKVDLGAHSSPDLFHVQHEVAKAMSLNLARQVNDAQQALETAQAERERHQRAQSDAERHQLPGRSSALAQRTDQARLHQIVAELDLEDAQTRQGEAKALLHELSDAYHPYELSTGQAQSSEQVGERLQACWKKLTHLARQAQLPERSFQQLRKAQRMTDALLATISFFFMTVTAKVEALNLTSEAESLVYERLIPAIYLDQVAAKTTDREQRHALHAQVTALLKPLNAANSEFTSLGDNERHELEQVATECAHLFQRSSSCVEGRNGQLALQHHSRHRLSDRKLAALTVVHNYHTQRPDGSTAAERFFRQKPHKLFDRLVQKLELPGRPAKKRPRPPKTPYLQPIAA